jgi:hypothetical protein
MPFRTDHWHNRGGGNESGSKESKLLNNKLRLLNNK